MVQTVTDEATGRQRLRPVLLDWGLAKSLPEKIKLGNALIVYSAWQFDVCGMVRHRSKKPDVLLSC